MDTEQFKAFCKQKFEKHGFKKEKKYFYRIGKDLLCGIDLQRSNFGPQYYINYFYWLDKNWDSKELPSYYDSDIDGRISAMSKTMTYQGKHFMTVQIEYGEYTEEELRTYFDKAFEEEILPPIIYGKKYILDNLGKIYELTLNQEAVLQKLQEWKSKLGKLE